jgi:hypothetical protein
LRQWNDILRTQTLKHPGHFASKRQPAQQAAYATGLYPDLLIEGNGKKVKRSAWPVTLFSSE